MGLQGDTPGAISYRGFPAGPLIPERRFLALLCAG